MSEQPFIERDPASAGRAGVRHRLVSADLFQGAREIIIEHGGQHYRLQITRAGKLILNK